MAARKMEFTLKDGTTTPCEFPADIGISTGNAMNEIEIILGTNRPVEDKIRSNQPEIDFPEVELRQDRWDRLGIVSVTIVDIDGMPYELTRACAEQEDIRAGR
ncbi:hypothetical protein JFK97_06585 [Chromobacterium phragmitis]|uniref:hypothetical protein n=1 Tax=Chromobacterium amazonense TaxID=1382803 RepID=UPI0021B80591|nr:hypothetical protein [Chromobacterium amazonense]MBM2884053.1 hypothetical protein [Chromobacterium amazonense]